MALSDEVKAKVSLRAIAEQTLTWDARKSNIKRGDYWAPCPFHGEKTASFHVSEPKGQSGQFYCFGCNAKGSVIDFLMARDGLTFTAAVRALADTGGIDRSTDPARLAAYRAQAEARQKQAEQEAADLAERGLTKAHAIWREAQANHPGLIAYLEGRGVRIEAIGGVPPTLRWHPDLPHYDRDAAGKMRVTHRGPAMVAFIGRQKLLGVQCTWVDPDPAKGRARLPDGRKLDKKTRGRTGELFGEPVVLSKPYCPLVVVAEGIETALAVFSATRAKNPDFRCRLEATLSLGALAGPEAKDGTPRGRSATTGKRLPSPVPCLENPRPGWLAPEGVTRGTILADPSSRCPETAEAHATRARSKLAHHLTHGARLAVPLGHFNHDDDFADLAKDGRLYE